MIGNGNWINGKFVLDSAIEERLLKAQQEVDRYRAALEQVKYLYEFRSELFTNDADLATSLYQAAREALPRQLKR